MSGAAPVPGSSWVTGLAERFRAHPAGPAVTVADAGLSITIGGRTLLIDPDRDDPNRAVFWLGLAPPAGLSDSGAARVAMEYTGTRMVETGCSMGYNAKAHTVLLGRSVDRGSLVPGQEAALLDLMVAEAGTAEKALAQARPSRKDARATIGPA